MDKMLKQKNEQFTKNVEKRGRVPTSLSVFYYINIIFNFLEKRGQISSRSSFIRIFLICSSWFW